MTELPKPAHFLLVEDEDAHAELVEMSLRRNNVANRIDRVTDGVAALDFLFRRGVYSMSPRPNLILLDLNLPKLNGHEVLEQIKASEELRSIPVVMLTTSAGEADRQRAYNLHANSFLTKPVDFQKFQQMMRALNFYWTAWNQPAEGEVKHPPDQTRRAVA